MSTAVATQPQKPQGEMPLAQVGNLPAKNNIPDLRRVLLAKKPELAAILGDDVAARLCTAVVTETVKSDRLIACSIQSLVSCAIEASRLKLEIGGVLGQCYMVPYGKDASLQIGYRGLITLAHRSRRVASICAVLVRDGDKFKIKQGTDRGIEHDPIDPPGKAWTHVYAVVQYRGGGTDFEIMTRDQVLGHRNRFSPEWKSRGESSIWGQHEEPMAMKTVLRKLLKRCPIGVDLGPDELLDGPSEIETIAAEQLPPHQQEQLREVLVNEAAEQTQAETKPTTAGAPAAESVIDEEHFRLAAIAEVERLAVQMGSWDDVRAEYAASFGFTGARAKDLNLDQALRFRNQLRLDVAAKGAA